MTSIFNVFDATILRAQSDQAGPPPAQDFAHELAKHSAQAKPPAQGNTKATAEKGFDQEQTLESAPTELVSKVDEALPQARLPDVSGQTTQAEAYIAMAPGGVTETLLEARVFGWHAMAQAYLSELSTTDERSPSHGTGQVDPAFTSAQAEAASDTPQFNTTTAAPIAAEESGAAVQLDVLPKVQPSITLDDGLASNTVEPAVTEASVSGFWPERSLRFTRQRDGGSVAWLRDFRLGDAEASHLIRFVLSDAQQKGIVLSRIMLNGREVWTSRNINQGACNVGGSDR
jgi:hypothetical protein